MSRTNSKLNGSVQRLAKAFGEVIQETMEVSETRMNEKIKVVVAEMRDMKKDTDKQFVQLRKDLKLKPAVTP